MKQHHVLAVAETGWTSLDDAVDGWDDKGKERN